MNVSRMFQACFEENSARVLNGSFKSMPMKFQGCLRNVSTMCQELLKCLSRKFQGIFKGVAMVFHGSLTFLKCFKVLFCVFQGSFVF